jgi:L-arabinonolactonase
MKRENADIECVVRCANSLGENPLWCAKSRSLYWINCERNGINCERDAALLNYDPATKVVKEWPMPKRIGAVALRGDGTLLIALADGIYTFDQETEALTLVASAPHSDSVVLHEGKCDRYGNFWIGSMTKEIQTRGLEGKRGGAYFYRLAGQALLPQIGDISVANGLAWSTDGKIMYHTDTLSDTVWAHDYDIQSCAISNRRVLFTVRPGEGMCDGAAVDSQGGYWVAMFQGSCIRRYTPDGRLDRELRLPVTQPTMMAFGGDDLQDLYLTTTRYGESQASAKSGPGPGDLYVIRGAGRGVREANFRS